AVAVLDHPEQGVRGRRVLRVVLGQLVELLREVLVQVGVLLDELRPLLALGLVDLRDDLPLLRLVFLLQRGVLLLGGRLLLVLGRVLALEYWQRQHEGEHSETDPSHVVSSASGWAGSGAVTGTRPRTQAGTRVIIAPPAGARKQNPVTPPGGRPDRGRDGRSSHRTAAPRAD